MRIRIPLMLVSVDKAVKASKRLNKLLKPLNTDFLNKSLRQARFKIKGLDYLRAAFVNSLVYLLLFGSLFTLLFYSQEQALNYFIFIRGFGIGLGLSTLFFAVFYVYPKIIAGKIGEIIDSELFFALNDMQVQVKAKVDLYQAIVNVIESGYDKVGDELQEVIDNVESGKSMIEALKKIALRTKSSFMKRVSWQLINSLKAGSSLENLLESLINELETHYHSLISNYTKELNVLTLVYLTLAVVAPTIGITVMIILSSFGGLVITQNLLSIIVGALLLIQPVIIGFINSRRPLIKI
ncbi:hypothetical protein GF352_02900 [archaeon]|nr:hypothetical protein [archaeon]